MRILCCIGARRGREVVQEVARFVGDGDELILLHVIETGPRHDLDRVHGPLHVHHDRKEQLDEVEEETAAAILTEAGDEAHGLGLTIERRAVRGKPEEVVVSLVKELSVDLVVLHARENPLGHPLTGPPSVGHVARFVVDHAAARVLLLRDGPAVNR